MAKITIGFGLALIALGMIAYFGSDIQAAGAGGDESVQPMESQTTDAQNADADKPKKKRSALTGLLIPGIVGLLLTICGIVALNEGVRKHAMHGAAMIGSLGALATIGKGSMDLVKWLSGGDVNGRAMTFVWLMAIICAAFVGVCVKSFIDARKRRELTESKDESAKPATEA